jgi:hypothetical protein
VSDSTDLNLIKEKKKQQRPSVGPKKPTLARAIICIHNNNISTKDKKKHKN